MTLQSLLEDKRYWWQNRAQEEILNKLLLRSGAFKMLKREAKEEKLVVLFGKPQVGKTTFLLSLMGVAEEQMDTISKILRAGIPEGNSSTSTGIIYQRSGDDRFGIAQHSVNNFGETEIIYCEKEEFEQRLKDVRKQAENDERDVDKILYLYIPRYFFDNATVEYDNIGILDMPGYGSRNDREKNHVDKLLNRYMRVAALNIIVRPLNGINDLREFVAPNGDRLDRMLHKYVVVTTHSYSLGNISQYFQEDEKKRKETFEEYLMRDCRTQFERIFGDKIPEFFPVDVGQSFYNLLKDNVKREEDRKELIAYRDRTFQAIRECIQKRKGNTLVSWVKELKEDALVLGNARKEEVENRLQGLEKEIAQNKTDTISKQKQRDSTSEICTELEINLQELKEEKSTAESITWDKSIKDYVEDMKNENFTSKYHWQRKDGTNNVADLFAELFEQLINNYLEQVIEVNKELEKWFREKNIYEMLKDDKNELRRSLNEKMYKHKGILLGLNPSNKDKIELGREKLEKECYKWRAIIGGNIKKFYEEREYKVKRNLKNYETLKLNIEQKLKTNEKRQEELEKKRKSAEEKMKGVLEKMEQDKRILNNFKEIATQKFQEQCNEIKAEITQERDAAKKVEWILLLGLICKDFERWVKE